jgi:hypothetical protein
MARGKKKPRTPPEFDPKEFKDEYLSRFVKDKKDNIKGETIGFEDKDLIVKKGDSFFRVPISAVELVEDYLNLRKKIDWKKAKVQGEKWRKKELDPL